jgi:hypothetical protein
MYENGDGIPAASITVSKEIYQIFGVGVSGVSSNNILLIESRGENAGYFTSNQNDMASMQDKLTFLGTVYIKPHPTHGISKCLDSVKIIDETTPAAMINLTDFGLFFGIESAALKEVRHINMVSMIDSFTFANEAVKLNFKRYLKDEIRSENQLINQLQPDILNVQGQEVVK